jgi:SAM-dependent methyltransferase
MWNQRYAEEGFVYGTQPNDFLAQAAARIPRGRVLSLAEGEGRNGVYLASLGYDVVGVDSSAVGMAKAQRLAREQGVELTTVVADLGRFIIPQASFSGVVSIFCHLPPEIRGPLLRDAVAGLIPGGMLVLEAYTPRQLEYGTGGPPQAELMMTLEQLRRDLVGLELEHALEIEREVHEGRYHRGLSSVVQVIGRKPEEP